MGNCKHREDPRVPSMESESDGPWLAQQSALAWTAEHRLSFTRTAAAGQFLQHRTHAVLIPHGVHSSCEHLLLLLGQHLFSAEKGEGQDVYMCTSAGCSGCPGCRGRGHPVPTGPAKAPPVCSVLGTRGDWAAAALSTGTQADVLRSVCWLTWLSRWVIAITSERTLR